MRKEYVCPKCNAEVIAFQFHPYSFDKECPRCGHTMKERRKKKKEEKGKK